MVKTKASDLLEHAWDLLTDSTSENDIWEERREKFRVEYTRWLEERIGYSHD